MKLSSAIRTAFDAPRTRFVKILPIGFEVDDDVHAMLCGSITDIKLVRKRFDNKQLLCFSADGKRTKDGDMCEQCNHPECRPRLRLKLQNARNLYYIELPYSSALNCVEFLKSLGPPGATIDSFHFALTVINRGSWGEVVFDLAP